MLSIFSCTCFMLCNHGEMYIQVQCPFLKWVVCVVVVVVNILYILQIVVVQSLSHVRLFETPWTEAHQAPCPLPTPGACSNSCPSSWWCHPTITSSVVHFLHQSFPASGSFPMSQLLTSGDQSIGGSASVSVLPMNIQGWFPLGLIGWIYLQFKGFSRILSNITVWKHQLKFKQLAKIVN